MSRYRIIFLGTADFAVPSLQACIENDEIDVVLVVSQPDRPAGRKMQLKASPIKDVAQKNSIDCITPESVNEPEVLSQIKKLNPDSAVVVAFGQLLKKDFIDLFPRKPVNIHGSLLPRWRGAAPIQRALIAGDKESGVALQKISLKLDAGDVLGTRKVALTAEVDAVGLYSELKEKAKDLIPNEYVDFLDGNLSGVKQDESLVCLAKKIKKEEGLIDWEQSAESIFNNYRGLKMWPGIWTIYQNKSLKLHNVRPAVGDYSGGHPGEVVELTKDSIVVKCGSGALEIFEVQAESRAKQAVSAFLNGSPLKTGDLLCLKGA